MCAMRPLRFALLLVSLILPALAQQAADPPPDILQIYVDAVKPGKMAEYIKIEAEAASACARNSTWPYMAMEAKTGPQEVWFLSGFDSYAAMESSDQPFVRNAALSADLNRLMEGKTNLVSDPHTIFLRYRGDLSRNRGLVPAQTRFYIVSVVKVHPGHEQEYEESQLLLRSARERAGTVDNRLVYQAISGIPDDTYITFLPHRSFRSAASTLDSLLDYDDLDDSIRGHLRELQAASIVSTETFVFSINPSISNPEGEWIADDPDFWKASPPLQRQGAKK